MHNEPSEIEIIWGLLRKHVPEVTSGAVRVVGIAREPGKRSVLAVASSDPQCDPVGTCVGLRGERVKRIIADLGGTEMVDIIRWHQSAERFIANLLAPLRIRVSFDHHSREAKATAVLPSGSRTPDIALRSKLLMELTGWRLHVEVRDED